MVMATTFIAPPALKSLFSKSGHRFTVGKIRDLEAAVAWAGRRRPVVFTNGVFDLLHPGHVELLDAARAKARRWWSA